MTGVEEEDERIICIPWSSELKSDPPRRIGHEPLSRGSRRHKIPLFRSIYGHRTAPVTFPPAMDPLPRSPALLTG